MCLQHGREGIGPKAGPSQLGLILFCQEWLAGPPLTAHEWWSGDEWGWGWSVDPPDTGCIMLGQCSDTAGSGTRQRLTLCVTCVCSRYPREKHTAVLFRLVIGDGCGHVLLTDTPIAYNRCVTAQRCSRVPSSLRGGGEVRGGALSLGHMQEVWACAHADFMSACPHQPQRSCFYLLSHQLLTLLICCLMRGSHEASRFN